jgi:MFS family permease
VSDRAGRLPIITGTLGVAGVSLVGAVVLADAGLLALGAVVVGLAVGSHGFRPVRGVYLVEILPDWIAAGGLGIVRTILMGAGAVSPAVVGFLAEAYDLRAAFALLAASMVGAAVVAGGLLLSEHTGGADPA